MVRQKDGRETWNRLLKWDKGQAPSERLAAQIIIFEGFKDVDPSHPLGGRDDLKDILCEREGKKFIVAAYFPRDQQQFAVIKNKLLNDVSGISKNNADGIVFITNQELRLSERDELKDLITEDKEVVIYHLERITSILNSPVNYGIRLEFLDIEMTKEEQLAYMASKDSLILELKNYLKQIVDFKSQDISKAEVARAAEVWPEYIFNNSSVINASPYHKCSHCGYGYKIAGSILDCYTRVSNPSSLTALSGWGGLRANRLISCPKCGNTEEYFSL